jgi:hypothetical protein
MRGGSGSAIVPSGTGSALGELDVREFGGAGDADRGGLARADGKADADGQAADLVGVDAERVLQAGAAEPGGAAVVVLDAGFHDQARAGDLDDLLRHREPMQRDRVGRANDPCGGLRATHALHDLGREDGGDAEAARAFHDVDKARAGLRDRRELITRAGRGLRSTAYCVKSSTGNRARRVASCLSRSPSKSR